jgi:hypothetical protein
MFPPIGLCWEEGFTPFWQNSLKEDMTFTIKTHLRATSWRQGEIQIQRFNYIRLINESLGRKKQSP